MDEKKGIIRRVLDSFKPKKKIIEIKQTPSKSVAITKKKRDLGKKSPRVVKKQKKQVKKNKKIKKALSLKKTVALSKGTSIVNIPASQNKWPKRNSVVLTPVEQNTMEVPLQKPKAEIDTSFDIVLAYVLAKGKVSASKTAKELGLSQKEVIECAKVLGEEGIITVEYPLMGGVILLKNREIIKK